MEQTYDDDDDLDELAHLHGFRLRRATVEPLDSLKDAEQIVPANYSIHVPPPNQGQLRAIYSSQKEMYERMIEPTSMSICFTAQWSCLQHN